MNRDILYLIAHEYFDGKIPDNLHFQIGFPNRNSWRILLPPKVYSFSSSYYAEETHYPQMDDISLDMKYKVEYNGDTFIGRAGYSQKTNTFVISQIWRQYDNFYTN